MAPTIGLIMIEWTSRSFDFTPGQGAADIPRKGTKQKGGVRDRTQTHCGSLDASAAWPLA
jgi:hypothetical protein